MPTAVTYNNQAPANRTQATGAASDVAATTSGTSGTFKDFMDSFLAGLGANQADGAGTTTNAGQGNATVLSLIAKLGLKPGDASATSDGTAATSGAKKADQVDANGVVIPVAVQPQLALGFANEGGLVETAAQTAISAATSGTPGAGLLVDAITKALGGSSGATQTADGAAAAATKVADSAAATAQATVNQTTAEVAAKAGDTAGLAAQGLVSIVGKATADASHTVANQTAPTADDPASNTAHVALTALQQSANLATTPVSSAADIRAKLQTAQLGAGKTSVVGAPEVGAASGSTKGDALTSAATGTAATTGANGLLDATAKQQVAQLGDKSLAAGGKSQDPLALSTADDKSQSSDTGQTFSDRLNAQFNANLAGLTQGQTTQTPAQAGAMSQAVPYAAIASTLISHAKAGSSDFNIRLDPAGLGQIDVKMNVSSDGQVRAHLIVDQPATLDLMMRDRQHLQQQLDQAGFKTDSSSLQFSLRDQGQGSNQQQAWQQQQDGSSRGQARAASLNDSASQLQSAVYARQSYVRTDAVDISI